MAFVKLRMAKAYIRSVEIKDFVSEYSITSVILLYYRPQLESSKASDPS